LATTLELFLQGGLGNQLIQQAYAQSLVRRSGASLRLNPLLLTPGWAALRRVTYRPRTSWLGIDCPETRSSPRQWLHWFRFYRARRRGRALHDGVADKQALALLRAATAPSWIPLLGYFQRAQAFGPAADGFWTGVAERLRLQHHLRPCPLDQVALHVRLGDYLLPQNQRLYAPMFIDQQLQVALSWREQLGGKHPLQVITDDPVAFQRLCPVAHRGEVRLSASSDSQTDFLALACHRRIVASNSTFSLCAGKLSSKLWGDAGTTLLPRHWYRESSRDAVQQHEWRQLEFVVDVWPSHL
jgi:hypothetical protein